MRDLLKAGCVALVLSLGFAAPAAAGPFEDGMAAHNRGDYATALRLWRPLAEQGNPTVQVLVGGMYALGQGVPQDYAQTVRWYRKAADQGDARGQYYLGVMYANGHGVRQDYVQAYKWCNVAVARFPPSETEDREKAVRSRELIATKMTAAQIAEAQRLTKQWKPK